MFLRMINDMLCKNGRKIMQEILIAELVVVLCVLGFGQVVFSASSDSGSISSEEFLKKASTRYGFNDMSLRTNPEGRIALYNEIETISKTLWKGVNDIAETEGLYIADEITLNDYGLSIEEAMEVYQVFRNDNPVYYFWGDILTVGEEVFFVVPEEYAKADERKRIAAIIESYVESCGSEILENNIYGSLLNIHDRIIKETVYSEELTLSSHSILGTIQYGQGVCETYARTYQLLLNYYSFSNVIVTGSANGMSHIWNIVELGDKCFYYVDCTYDDTGMTDDYFCIGMDEISATHVVNQPTGQGEEFLYAIPTVSQKCFDVPEDLEYSDGILNYVISYSGRAKVVGYLGEPVNLIIPEMVNGAKVTEICNNAFYNCESLEIVSFPNTLKSININDDDYGAFEECPKLAEVVFPLDSRLEYIGYYSFGFCTSLKKMRLPDSVRYLGEGVFCGCVELEEIYLPEGLETIEQCAITNTAIKTINIPSSVNSYSGFGICENDNLERIEVAEDNLILRVIDNVLYLYSDWYETTYNSNEECWIPEYVGTGWGLVLYPRKKTDTHFSVWKDAMIISDSFDLKCHDYLQVMDIGMLKINLQVITCDVIFSENNPYYIKEGDYILTRNGKELVKAPAFNSEEMIIPFGVEKLGFHSCAYTKNEVIYVPEGVKEIDGYAFECSDAVEIKLPNTISRIGDGAFEDCIFLQKVILPYELKKIEMNTFLGCQSLQQITLPDGLEIIGRGAFSQSGLENIIIPASVKEIGIQAFMGCNYLRYVNISGDNTILDFECFSVADGGMCIVFRGNAPVFSEETFLAYNDSSVTIQYPRDDNTWLPVIDHNYGTDVFVKENYVNWASYGCPCHLHVKNYRMPSCTETGEFKYVCKTCGEQYKMPWFYQLTEVDRHGATYQKQTINAIGHCYVDGVCINCGEKRHLGDCNGDGEVNRADRMYLARALNGWDGYELPSCEVADFTGDGEVNRADRMYLARALTGWEDYNIE